MAAMWKLCLLVYYVLLSALDADGGSYNTYPFSTTAHQQSANGQSRTATSWGVTASYESAYAYATSWDNVTASNVSSEQVQNNAATHICGQERESWAQQNARTKLMFMPVIAVVGITGNMLSFVVMGANVYHRKSYSYYLRALSIFDSLTIVTTAVIMGNDISRYIGPGAFLRAHSVFTCKLTNFLSSVVFLMSSWLIVAFTIDRYIAVCHPLQLYRLCTATRAKVAILLILVLIMISQAFRFYYIDKLNRKRPCHVARELRMQYFGLHYLWFSFTLRFALPFVIIAVCNGLIIFHVQRMQSIRHTGLPKRKRKRTHRAVTTLIAVSTLFVVSLVPSAVVSLVQFVRGTSAATYCALVRIDTPLQMVRLLNYSFNFALYGLTGRLFRSELKRLLTCKRQTASSPASNKLLKVNFHRALQRRLPALGKPSGAPCGRLVGGGYHEKRLFFGRNNIDYNESEV